MEPLRTNEAMIMGVRTMSTHTNHFMTHITNGRGRAYDPEDPRIIVDHLELDNNNRQEFGIEDHGDESNRTEVVSDPTDIELDIIVDVATDIKVEVTTNM
ncbi:hypothetical protein PVK06_005064 [Gossypium arboreum]|uniref:Uncharacterized protein n=1 Tax=Gossypium arboreum TaxID=29729 RepID=A0ABR0QTM7_GOSAR|nr:hypothetical protein PVK06_005064 [Gossypium arboreum]